MACFLASAAEAVVVTAAAKATEKKADATGNSYQAEQRISFSKKA